jgi:hypothetical protein
VTGCDSGDKPPPNDGSAIASLGDSVASGEGNPSPHGPRWENGACHRSPIAGQAIAAKQAQKDHPGLGFFDYACSGASIPKGLLGPYRGIEPAIFQPARSQVDQLGDAAATTKPSGGLAAVMISIGANDVGFSKVFKFCTLVKRCWEQHFNPDFPYAVASGRYPLLQQFVGSALAEVPQRLNRLDAALAPLVPPRRVIVVDYFDPTTGADGAYCTMLFGGVTPDESRWAQEQVLKPLNSQIEASAKDHDWNVVSGVAERFRGHGLCAPESQRWVRTLGEGLSGQPLPLTGVGVAFGQIQDVIGSTAGTLHPNGEGQRQIALLIDPVLAKVLSQ